MECNAHIWGEEFEVYIIDKEEFEHIWSGHFYDGFL